MPALSSDRRKQLENVVQEARDIAETAARAALDRLAVAETRPWDHLSTEQKELRNRLRAHARQLGDVRKASGEQEVEHLVGEVAYQQWHRMLFARFLAENHLLIHPELGVPVTLEECEELAADEGAEDEWVLAGRFAARMLPQIFRPDEPSLALGFAPEHQRALEELLESVPAETFQASDTLGWVYQFWQSKKKEEVNRSGVKIGPDELPAVTQLFTEPYMVQFLLHNTLGAWWLGRHPDEDPPFELQYLRRLEDGTPAAGTFEGWPKRVREVTVLDPCCGSGHFLVAAFELLVPMRMREEGLGAREACERVLAENVFGLEIDERCTQIAAFALALAAWTYPEAGGYRPLPELNVACSGLAVGAKRDEWLALANGDERLRQGMSQLYDLFQNAPMLGSLIDPKRSASGDLLTAGFSELQPLLTRALERERREGDHSAEELGSTAQGIAQAADMLAGQYTLVTTNVPYLGRGKQVPLLQDFCLRWYPAAKPDLAAVFMLRCTALCGPTGNSAVVTPQSWMHGPQYESLRNQLIARFSWNLLSRLGSGAFEGITGEVVNVALAIVGSRVPPPDHRFSGLDVSDQGSPLEKAAGLRLETLLSCGQRDQLKNPDARVLFTDGAASGPFLAEFGDSYQGLVTGDQPRFVRSCWEIDPNESGWVALKTTSTSESVHAGVESALWWQSGRGELADYAAKTRDRLHDMHESGNKAWGYSGVAIERITLRATLYSGEHFENNTAVIVPEEQAHLPALWAFCSSRAFVDAVRKIDPKLNITNRTLLKIPFNLEHWQRVAEEQYPDGLPEPYSADPTQWLFKGEVADTTEPLQVVVARLLGYRWPDQEPDDLDALADEDGIVCIPSVRGEEPAADRLRELLARAYGSEWSPVRERALLEQTGAKSRTLEEWLRNEFFGQHFRLFQHRPFIWQIWDGARSGFSALVNYHRLDRKHMELLTYTYLGDWIRRQEHAQKQGESGADERLVRARELQKKLQLILEGEAPYDIFVRWKPLEEQPIGWQPDLNDGVRINIRPFFEAGVLRKNPNIHWKKDRGKDPADAAWGEERVNDRHLTLSEKRAARAW
jgi:hypothetical protein